MLIPWLIQSVVSLHFLASWRVSVFPAFLSFPFCPFLPLVPSTRGEVRDLPHRHSSVQHSLHHFAAANVKFAESFSSWNVCFSGRGSVTLQCKVEILGEYSQHGEEASAFAYGWAKANSSRGINLPIGIVWDFDSLKKKKIIRAPSLLEFLFLLS